MNLHAMESAANVVSGYVINLMLMYVLLHWVGYQIKMNENAGIGLIIAVFAFIRGYLIRIYFNKWTNQKRQ